MITASTIYMQNQRNYEKKVIRVSEEREGGRIHRRKEAGGGINRKGRILRPTAAKRKKERKKTSQLYL